MRQRFNLDIVDASRAFILIHGVYASGKTHLLGDFLAHEAQYGSVKFINTKGEDGYGSAASFDLGEIGETVETYDDIVQVLDECERTKLHALAIDSMKHFSRISMRHVLGDDRLPRGGSGQTNEWGPVHFEMEQFGLRLRRAATLVMAVCPSDRNTDAITKKTYISPDLPGRQALASAGWVDFVFYLKAENLAPGKVRRSIVVAPNDEILVRQRLRYPLLNDIIIPEGRGGWLTIKRALEAAATSQGDKVTSDTTRK